MIGVVSMIAGSAAFALAVVANLVADDHSDGSFDAVIRWSTFHGAAQLAGTLLVAAALFGVAGRLSGWVRTVVLVAAWTQAAWTCWVLVQPYVFQLFADSARRDWYDSAGWKLVAVVMWGQMVAITVAARAWWRPATPWVTVAAVVLVVLESVGWVPSLMTSIYEWGTDHPYAVRAIWPLREALTGGALLIVVYGIVREAPAVLPDPARAARWLHRAGAALLIRLIVAIALGVLGIGLIKSPSVIKVVFLVGPAIALLSIYGFGWSLLSLERAVLPGMPGLRLALGALASAIAASLQSVQLLAVYKQFADRDAAFSKVEATSWTVIGPLIGIAGVGLACWAIAAWARTIGDERLRELAIGRAIVYAILNALVMVLPFLIESARSASTVLVLGLLAAVGAIVALVLVASVFHRAAEAIAPGPSLPEARLR